jgi:Mce-associated membrane protein
MASITRTDDDPSEDVADADDAVRAATGGDVATRPRVDTPRLAFPIGLAIAAVLVALCCWLAYQFYHQRQVAEERSAFLQAGRQQALNLTTIDWQHADTDIERIRNLATGPFYDDFSKRSQPFIEVVRQTRAKTEGSVTEAGVESVSGSDATVLVAVIVKTSNEGAPAQPPRSWRMRMKVQTVGDDVKVANVEFVA